MITNAVLTLCFTESLSLHVFTLSCNISFPNTSSWCKGIFFFTFNLISVYVLGNIFLISNISFPVTMHVILEQIDHFECMTCLIENLYHFSSPELKAQIHFSDRPSLNFSHIIYFFSRTTGPISTKSGTNHPQIKGIQFIFFFVK